MSNFDFIKNSKIKPFSTVPINILEQVLETQKYLKEDSNGNMRCDNFIKDHKNKHILFMGDSFTAGDGLLVEECWTYKVFNKINKKENTSGYYNIGCSGTSIIESIFLFFEYCKNFGNPNVIFFMMTDPSRDYRVLSMSRENQLFMLQNIYSIFEFYCKINNINLYSFTWLKFVEIDIHSYRKFDLSIHNKSEPLNKTIKNYLYDFLIFDTYYDYEVIDMMKSVWRYDQAKEDKELSLLARDKLHAGTSFHDFWADFIYDKYEKNMIK